MQITLNLSDEIGKILLQQPNPELFVQKAIQMMIKEKKTQQGSLVVGLSMFFYSLFAWERDFKCALEFFALNPFFFAS